VELSGFFRTTFKTPLQLHTLLKSRPFTHQIINKENMKLLNICLLSLLALIGSTQAKKKIITKYKPCKIDKKTGFEVCKKETGRQRRRRRWGNAGKVIGIAAASAVAAVAVVATGGAALAAVPGIMSGTTVGSLTAVGVTAGVAPGIAGAAAAVAVSAGTIAAGATAVGTAVGVTGALAATAVTGLGIYTAVKMDKGARAMTDAQIDAHKEQDRLPGTFRAIQEGGAIPITQEMLDAQNAQNAQTQEQFQQAQGQQPSFQDSQAHFGFPQGAFY
jgi:hypothetical protein